MSVFASNPVIVAAVRTPAARVHIEVALRNVVRVDFSRDPCADLAADSAAPPSAVLIEMTPNGDHRPETLIRAVHRQSRFTPIIAYCARSPHGGVSQSVLAAARAGAEYLILKEYDDIRRVVTGVIDETRFTRVVGDVLPLLDRSLPDAARSIVAHCIAHAALPMTVEQLAGVVGVHRRTLTRRLHGMGLQAPESVIGWGRLLVAAHFLEHTDASTERVALHLGWVSGSAFRGMLKRYTTMSPADLSRPGGVLRVARRFAATCRPVDADSRVPLSVGLSR